MKRILLLTKLLILFVVSNAQTVLIKVQLVRGFENGSSFAANGWTVANGATNQWFIGSVAPPSLGANCAYISDNVGGATYNYATGAASTVHFYRDVTFPVGETDIQLTYKWKCFGEGSYDYIAVFAISTALTPTLNSPAGAFQSWLQIPTAYPGATVLNTPPQNLQANFQTATICLPAIPNDYLLSMAITAPRLHQSLNLSVSSLQSLSPQPLNPPPPSPETTTA